MANDSTPKSSKKKRKVKESAKKERRTSKTPRIGEVEDEREKKKQLETSESSKRGELEGDVEASGSWRNLQLILFIQDRKFDIQKKLELAFDFVSSRLKEGCDRKDDDDDDETVSLLRVVVFLGDWVQSLLSSTDKKIKDSGGKLVEACLDYRCWLIFKFCLEESLRLQSSLGLSRNLLRSITCVARHAQSLVTDTSPDSKGLLFFGDSFQLYETMLDCVSRVFSSHGVILNESLNLWIPTIRSVIELVLRIYDMNLENAHAGAFAMQFSCLVLEPFAKYLRVHSTRKAAFIDFVNQLLEPLLHLLGFLHLHCEGNVSCTSKLKINALEVLSQGLFHPSHIDGFLNLRSSEKYSGSQNGKIKETMKIVQSYHRHLFDKLEGIIATKNNTALSGFGDLFQLFVDQMKMQKVASILPRDFNNTGATPGVEQLSVHGSITIPPENYYGTCKLDAEKRKSIINFFVLVMEPLLLQLNGYFKSEDGPFLLDALCTLRSINGLLASFLHEQVYLKTEDIIEGACINFLKSIHNEILSFASSLQCLPSYDKPHQSQKILALVAKEVLAAVAYMFDIDYEVIGDELANLWLMILCYLAIAHSLKDVPEKHSLESKTLQLGCKLITTYSDLRQVNNAIFALCKAIRSMIVCSNDCDGEKNYGTFRFPTTSIVYAAYSKAVEGILCSQEFKSAIRVGVNTTPEGQASECVRQLGIDLSKSMTWMKVICPVSETCEYRKPTLSIFNCGLQAELLGRGLSELYLLVLDSLPVTIGNSSLLRQSVEDLMTAIRPYFSILVRKQPDGVKEFMSSVTGRDFCEISETTQTDMQNFRMSASWVIVFFFQLYISCRSLYRQIISLAPPDASRKMSAAMGDSFTAYSGMDSMDRSYLSHEGYFSWIVQPSTSLLVVIRSVTDTCLQVGNEGCWSLVYILLVVALQGLCDLNRQIRSSEYMEESMDKSSQTKQLNDADLSLHRRRSRKWKKCLSSIKQEAEGLTGFIMKWLSSVSDNHLSAHASDNDTSELTCDLALHDSSLWDFGVCSIDKRSLRTAIWWLICQNVDIWSVHASKKKLNVFLTLVIQTSLPIIERSFTESGNHLDKEVGAVTGVTVHQISSLLLSVSLFYEHKFVHRHLASRFCYLLQQSALLLFNEFAIKDVDLDSPPNWQEVLSALENSSMVVPSCKSTTCEKFPDGNSVSIELNGNMFRRCHSLLGLLCWMPKDYMSSRSFSVYTTHVLNLERLIIRCLLECDSALSLDNQFKLSRLLLSCRRALKYLVTTYSEKLANTGSVPLHILSDSSSSVLWLFKSMSLVVGLLEKHTEGNAAELKDVLVSLMDHTSHLYCTLTKYRFTCGIQSAIPLNSDLESADCMNHLNGVASWDSLLNLSESLKDQTQDIFFSLKQVISNDKVGENVSALHLNKLSSIITCVEGFFWGLASSLTNTNASESAIKVNLMRWELEPLSKINDCLCMFEKLTSFLLRMLFVEGDHIGNLVNLQDIQKMDHNCGLLISREHSLQGFSQTQVSCEELCQCSAAACSSFVPCDMVKDSSNGCNSSPESEIKVSSVLSQAELIEQQPLNKKLLQSLVKGDHHGAAMLIRHLLIASSAILRLNFFSRYTPCVSSLVPSLIGISKFFLSTLSDKHESPHQFSFIWLDGVLKCLEELGSHFSLTSPALTRNLFVDLIELHVKALGKCLALQGKGAALSSHQRESNKALKVHEGSKASGSHILSPIYCYEFRDRLRASFKGLITNASELHLLSAIQAIERAVVGVNEDFQVIYEIDTGSIDGGHVSSTVAAGVDCMDLILEYVSGRRRLNVIKRHIQNLIASLFNIVLHLQSPLIYYVCSAEEESSNSPDPGAVILMSVEVLARVFAKHALYKMDTWHVTQSLRIPAALFQDFCHFRSSKGSVLSGSFSLCDEDHTVVAAMNSQVLDQRFSVDLFTACCRLLYTILKHHKSESESGIALLQDSVSVLLNCLETAKTDTSARKCFSAWGPQEGEQCACSLRRIYEELRQQKDIFGRHCFKFLSNYVWVFSGFGPLKAGLPREVDAALKPGVYALIDCCSVDDLQHLHSSFGEGPCRNTLASLQHDYKINFQYEGKV